MSRIVRHLLDVLKTRGEKVVWLEEGRSSPDYGPAFRGLSFRLMDRLGEMARQRLRLPSLLGRLRKLSPEDRRTALRSDPELRNWPLGEWLIEESRQSLGSDLDRALDLAGSAVILAEALDPASFGGALICDLKARAWGARGEALRRLADLGGAGEAFAVAEGFLFQGTGDALEEAELLELKAALFRDQSRTREAHSLLGEVTAVYRQYRDPHLLGRAFIQKGRVHGQDNELEVAIDWLRKGLGLIDPERDRSLDLAARHCLMLYLTESGRPREARFLLRASRIESLRYGSPRLLSRLRWLEGKIYQALGFPVEAERAFLDARQELLRLQAELNAAVVSLDLAVLYVAEGRAAEARSLAEEILPIFQSRDLHREAIAAIIALQRVSRRETTGARLLAEIRTHIDQVRRDPRLRFEPL